MTGRSNSRRGQLIFGGTDAAGMPNDRKFDTHQLREAAIRIANRAICRFGWPNRPSLVYQQFKPASPRFDGQDLRGYGTAVVSGQVRVAGGMPLMFTVPVPVRGGEACMPGTFRVGSRSYVLASPGVAQALADNEVRDLSADFDPSRLYFSEDDPVVESFRSLIDLGGLQGL